MGFKFPYFSGTKEMFRDLSFAEEKGEAREESCEKTNAQGLGRFGAGGRESTTDPGGVAYCRGSVRADLQRRTPEAISRYETSNETSREGRKTQAQEETNEETEK